MVNFLDLCILVEAFFCKTTVTFSLHLLLHYLLACIYWCIILWGILHSGTCLIASNIGIFTCTLQKVSKISFSCHTPLFWNWQTCYWKVQRIIRRNKNLKVTLCAKIVSIWDVASSFSRTKSSCYFILLFHLIHGWSCSFWCFFKLFSTS